MVKAKKTANNNAFVMENSCYRTNGVANFILGVYFEQIKSMPKIRRYKQRGSINFYEKLSNFFKKTL